MKTVAFRDKFWLSLSTFNMQKALESFLEIAPKLGGIITILGIVIFLFFWVLRGLIEGDKLRAASETTSGQLLHKVLDYAFWLAVIVVALGFWVLMLPKLFPDVRYAFWFSVAVLLVAAVLVARLPRWIDRQSTKAPRLALSFADRAQMRRFFGDTPLGMPGVQEAAPPLGDSDNLGYSRVELTSPVEHFVFDVAAPRSFEDVSPDPTRDRQDWFGGHGLVLFPFVVNLGNETARNIWFKLHIDSSVSLWAVLPTTMDMATDEITGKSVIEFVDTSTDLAPATAYNTHAQLPFHFWPIPENYAISYEVGSANSETVQRVLTIQVRSKDVPDAYVENARGLRDYTSQDTAEAARHFENATKMDPTVGGFFFNLGTALCSFQGDQERLKRAENAFAVAYRLSPEQDRVIDSYGWALAKAGQLDEALKLAHELLHRKVAPKNLRSAYLGACLRDHNISLAVNFLEAELAAFPNEPLFLSELGMAYAEQDRVAEGEALIQQAIKLAPDFDLPRLALDKVRKKRMSPS
ncbi:MAG: hypothetical protein QOE70_1639 [Chthoniobacter sp.]|jgi:Flp pilus assembly protein TadD|nr:hypothetical protein [Chthoniobacter sp.]